MQVQCPYCSRYVVFRVEYYSVYGYKKTIYKCPCCGKVVKEEEDEDEQMNQNDGK